jgi:hypothetical protein
MTPQEKAIEIYYQMYRVRSGSYSSITSLFAKKSAKICADIIVNEWTLATKGLMPSDDQYSFDQLNYWKKVKEQIEKL